MVWASLARRLQDHGSLFAPVFFFLGVLIMIVLPYSSPIRYSVDENALGLYSPAVDMQFGQNSTLLWDRRLVRGTRSPGSEVIAVYVNTDSSVSVRIANVLIHNLERRSTMSADVLFFFVSKAEPWPLPSAPTRAALVINISSLERKHMCVETQGEDGTRPNQDLLNLAVTQMLQARLVPLYLCQVRADGGGTLSPLSHALLDMKQSIRTSLHPEPWHTFGTHSVNTIAFSTASEPSGGSVHRDQTARFFLHLITILNGLDERLHHSTFMWFSSEMLYYLQYDVLQFSTILFVATIVATSYSIYQRHGVIISPLPVAAWVVVWAAEACQRSCGTMGVAAVTVAGIVALSCMRNLPAHCAMWMTLNAVALCLMILLNPGAGLLVGGGTALQMLFLHDRLESPFARCTGALVAWGVAYLVCVEGEMPLWSTRTFGDVFISFFVYANALWVSAAAVRSVCRTCQCKRTSLPSTSPAESAACVAKKMQ